MTLFRKHKALLAAVILIFVTLGLSALVVSAQALKTRERLTIDATVGGVGLGSSTISPAAWTNSTQPDVTYCRGVLETAQIRWLANGDAPDANNGEPLEVGAMLELYGTTTIKQWRGIRTGASSGVIDWQCGR